MTGCHTLGGSHNRNVLSHGSGSRKSEAKVSAELVPSKAVMGRSATGYFARLYGG